MNSPEQQVQHEERVDLSDSVIGIRVFKIGEFDQESEEVFSRQVRTVKEFDESLIERFGEKSPNIEIITNSDLEEFGQQVLTDSGLRVVKTQKEKAEERAELGHSIIGERSAATGDFSYADMLNAAINENEPSEKAESYIFTSADLGNKPKDLIRQVVGMRILYDKWNQKNPSKLAMVGSLVADVHDIGLVDRAIKGTEGINLENLNAVFPNNTLSMVSPDAKFSGVTDNALTGTIEINGKSVPIGGNEDFYYGFGEMISGGRDCVLLIDPFVAGEREGEVKGVQSKYARRQAIYQLYAKRLLNRALRANKITLGDGTKGSSEQIETIVENMVDEHLFFARVDQNGQPEIVLTDRQERKKISKPI